MSPKEIKDATLEYRSDMDTLADFLKEHTVTQNNIQVTSKQLYGTYARWCASTGERQMTKSMLGRKLKERGYINDKIGGTQYWFNVKIINTY